MTDPVLSTGRDDTGAAAGQPIVELDDVHVHYRIRKGLFRRSSDLVRAVDGVSLRILKGETLGLVGSTGSGKSTVAGLIMGMIQPDSGQVRVAGARPHLLRGRELLAHRRRVQMVLQDPYSSMDPRMRVRDVIAEPLTRGYPLRGRDPQVRHRVAELLGLVGLPHNRGSLYPHQFSGGQRQRIAIARALAPQPEIVVLDEPTSALDVSVRAQILNLLRDIQERLNVTYLMISHDLSSVAFLASNVAVMREGRIVEQGPTRQVYLQPAHPYTAALLASVPGMRRLEERES